MTGDFASALPLVILVAVFGTGVSLIRSVDITPPAAKGARDSAGAPL